MDPNDLRDKLDELAKTMLEEAGKPGATLPQRIDVFKICSQHYVNVSRVGKFKGGGVGDGDTPSMEELRNRANSGQGEEDDESSASS